MDEPSLKQVEAFWPDVAGPFSRVVPDGLHLIHLVDAWTGGAAPLRVRQLDLYPVEGAPTLDALLEEADEDAVRRGWTRLDDEAALPDQAARDEAPEHVYELEGVHLYLAIRTVRVLGEPWAVLRARFDQPWPDDAGAPVETSEMFQTLVRQLLRLGAHPERLSKDVTFDPFEAGRADVILEQVELAKDRDISRELVKLSFRPVPDPSRGPEAVVFVSKSVTEVYDVAARVRELAGGARYEVELRKKRLLS